MRGLGDVELDRWTDLGLLKPSWVRLGKLITVHESLVIPAVGMLSHRYWERVRREN